MKTEKMSFKNIKDVLSRDEMKKIMAGSGAAYFYFCTCSNGTGFACLARTSTDVVNCISYYCPGSTSTSCRDSGY